MPPNEHSKSTTAMTNQQNSLARAIEIFLSDISRKEDVKSPFYKEVLSQLSSLLLQDSSPQQSRRCADELSAFIEELERRHRRESMTMRIAEKLRPLVTGLSQYTSAFDVAIQGSPAPGTVLYGGARLILQVSAPVIDNLASACRINPSQLAQSFYQCFDYVLDIMAEIGHLLRCYELFAAAYRSSTDVQSLLVESYKNIVCFWQKAAKLLSRKSDGS
jgi:hypothetical protein